MADAQFFTTLGITLIVCRNKDNKILAVKETKNRGWWLPGGRVDPPEDFFTGALREMKEEGGIDVQLKGILRFEYQHVSGSYFRLKIIFYAEPIDPDVIPDKKPDEHSEDAKWVTIDEIQNLKNGKPGWRGPELYQWANYLDQGGVIFPLSMFKKEGTQPELIQNSDFISKLNNLNIQQQQNYQEQQNQNKQQQSLLNNQFNQIQQDTELGANNVLFIQKLPPKGKREIRLISAKQVAFAEYDSNQQALNALKGLNGYKISNDHQLQVSYAKKI